MNYQDAIQLIGKRKSKKLANNTYLQKRGGNIAVMLHSTDIIIFHPDGKIVFNTGGWRTATTKDRINRFSPVYVTQTAGIWYIGNKIFADGCCWRNGKLYGAAPAATAKTASKQLKELKKYCTDFINSFFEFKIPAPSEGDCWICVSNSKDADHIQSHITEKYFVPTLLVNACSEFPISPIAESMFYYVWNPKADRAEVSEFTADIARKQMQSSLYRYCKQSLGFAS